MEKSQDIVVIRGGGDLATGVIQKFWRAGFSVCVLETAKPLAIRRTVTLSEAVYQGSCQVEDVIATLIDQVNEAEEVWAKGRVPLLIDPQGSSIGVLKPLVVVDCILAKRNLGTNKSMAPITLALGPGFRAGEEVDGVIETMRGHDLGRLIFSGEAIPNTGIPGEIGGQSALRVVHAPCSGIVSSTYRIGDIVEKGQEVLKVADTGVLAPFTGLLRGLIPVGTEVPKGMKIADIDPRTDVDCYTISDKARCLGGAALEAALYFKCKKKVG